MLPGISAELWNEVAGTSRITKNLFLSSKAFCALSRIIPHDSWSTLRPPVENAHQKTLHPGSFPLVGAFDFWWVPTEVQSTHFQHKSTLMVNLQKDEKCPAKGKSTQRKEKNDTAYVCWKRKPTLHISVAKSVWINVAFFSDVLFCAHFAQPKDIRSLFSFFIYFLFWARKMLCWALGKKNSRIAEKVQCRRPAPITSK